jgi:hypothetical protein
MADIPQVLATYDALVGVALGAGLTYGLGALNRRHQEAREDRTRWYEARREAYGALHIAASRLARKVVDTSGKQEISQDETLDEIIPTLYAVRLVGSPSASDAADNLIAAILADMYAHSQAVKKLVAASKDDESLDNESLLKQLKGLPRGVRMPAAFTAFEKAGRKDLGHP